MAGVHAWRSHAAMRFPTPVIHPRDQEQALRNVNVCAQAGARGVFPINHQMPCFQLAEIAAAARSPFPKARIGINVPEEHPLTAIPARVSAEPPYPTSASPHCPRNVSFCPFPMIPKTKDTPAPKRRCSMLALVRSQSFARVESPQKISPIGRRGFTMTVTGITMICLGRN